MSIETSLAQAATLLAKIRVRLWRSLSRLVLGSLAGTIPARYVRSIDEVCYREGIARHVVDRIVVYPPAVVSYPFPAAYPACFTREKTFEQKSLFVLRDVCVSPNNGLVWLPDHSYILLESVGSILRILSWGGLHEPLRPTRKLDCDDIIVACPPTGYYHWLFEVLPNIIRVQGIFPEAKILLPPRPPHYLLQALELLVGSEALAARLIVAATPVTVKNLVMPQIDVYSGFVPPDDLALLVSTLRACVALPAEPPASRLYISRSRTRKRALSNEHELEGALAASGFQIVHCEELTFAEQIALLSTAAVIVAPHGAGLSNLIWASPPCRILEIFPTGMFNDCYARLALSLGMAYQFTRCEADVTPHGRIPVGKVMDLVAAYGG